MKAPYDTIFDQINSSPSSLKDKNICLYTLVHARVERREVGGVENA
jgi:hypothetical protein